jgi:predicted mannosyl-3-phosphoglycerate phosphatase (HAD superfamily)
MILAIDFDGTLVKHAYPAIGEPNTHLIYKLKKLQEKGHKLILWTCRDKEELVEAVEWCKLIGLIFDAVNDDLPEIKKSFKNKSLKIYADIYLDDRNISIQDFLQCQINK